MRFVTYILVGSLLTLGLGCSSDSNTVEVVIPTELCVGFVPSELPVSGNVVSRLRADSTCAVAFIEVVGTDIDDVFSVAAHINYDRTAVEFLQLDTNGSALSQDGALLNVRVEELVAGELTIGVARNANDSVDIVGTRLLMTLLFLPLNLGASEMAVETPCLTNGDEPPLPLGDVSCSGGSFDVERNN
jgi:hypothetical protein